MRTLYEPSGVRSDGPATVQVVSAGPTQRSRVGGRPVSCVRTRLWRQYMAPGVSATGLLHYCGGLQVGGERALRPRTPVLAHLLGLLPPCVDARQYNV